MANLREIRNRIKGVKNTAKITSAMKMVSAAKLKRAQGAIESARPYVLKLNDVLSNLVSNIGDDYENPLINKKESIKNVAVVIIGSDRGLCGSFNSNILKESFKFISTDVKKEFGDDVNISVIPVGKKAVSFYKKNSKNLTVINNYPDIFGKLDFQTAKNIINDIKELYIDNKIDKVYVFVNEFVNIIRQIPTKHVLLPIEPKKSDKTTKFSTDYIFEPNQKEILDELLPKLLNISIWRYLLESSAAEQASRMMAMDNATKNANELGDALNLKYNKERQAAITTEMLEIVGGANALDKS